METLLLILAGIAIGAIIVGVIALYAFGKLSEIVLPLWRK